MSTALLYSLHPCLLRFPPLSSSLPVMCDAHRHSNVYGGSGFTAILWWGFERETMKMPLLGNVFGQIVTGSIIWRLRTVVLRGKNRNNKYIFFVKQSKNTWYVIPSLTRHQGCNQCNTINNMSNISTLFLASLFTFW